jgi:hypothetical protein
VTDQRRLNLPLFALGAVAAHAVVLAALLPMLVTLPGAGSNRRGHVVIDVDVTPLPASGASSGTTGSPTHDRAADMPNASPPTDTTSAISTGTADPLTTQAVTRAIQDQAKKTAGAGGSASGEAGPGASPPDGVVARAEPSEPLPPETTLEQGPAKKPTAEKSQPAAKPEAKKPAANTQDETHAKPVTPRPRRLVRAKPKSPAKGDFQTLFSGTILAPALPPDKRATR